MFALDNVTLRPIGMDDIETLYQDLHVYGILKPEFYQRYSTIFQLPKE